MAPTASKNVRPRNGTKGFQRCKEGLKALLRANQKARKSKRRHGGPTMMQRRGTKEGAQLRGNKDAKKAHERRGTVEG